MSSRAAVVGDRAVSAAGAGRGSWRAVVARAGSVSVFAPIARALFAAIFVMAGFTHFSEGAIGYAAYAGVPAPQLLVPFSGVLALAGGLSVVLGYRARLGAWLLVIFLVPVTLAMHAFWGLDDPMAAQLQQAMFMKNLALLGGALLIARFGAGPLSLDARRTSRRE